MTPEIHGMDNVQREDNSKNYGISFVTQQIGAEKKETEVANTRNSTLNASDVDALLSNSKTEVKVDNNCTEKNKAEDKENPVPIITDSERRATVEKLRQLIADDKAGNYEKAYELYMVVIEDIGVYLFDKESQKKDIVSKWMRESEKKVSELFKRAPDEDPTIILLTKLTPYVVHEAMRRRFDMRIYIALPESDEEKIQIFKVHSGNTLYDLSDKDFKTLPFAITKGFLWFEHK
nr:protein suppressor of k(+) transport growth defect 1 [Quercus suber]